MSRRPARMWSAPPAEPPVIVTAALLIDLVDEIFESFVRGGRRDHDDQRLLREFRDRRRVLDPRLGGVRLDRSDHDEPHDHEAVGITLVREGSESHRPASPSDIRDGSRADEALRGQVLRQRASGLVPSPAGVGRRDELHGVEGYRGAIRIPARVTCRRTGGEAEHRGDADAREGATPCVPPQSRVLGRRGARCEIAILLLDARTHPRAEPSMWRTTLGGCPRPRKLRT